MFRIPLFKIRAFTAGNLASLMSALGRGGLMFILIIWLQGIWLPRHGYSFSSTPLWAGIYMLPLTTGFLIAGPTSGWLSDRFGARPFATGGMLLGAATFGLLEVLPVNFTYPWFAVLLLMNGLAMGLFASPNRAAIMNSLPPDQRGQGSGMSTTFQNSAMVLSIGIFFTLIITGLSAHLPATLARGLTAQGVPAAAAAKVAALPPTATVFGAFLGYNPIASLLGPTGVLAHLPAARVAYLTGRGFFPDLISAPFTAGLHEAFDFAIAACLIAAVASWLRGKPGTPPDPGPAPAPAPAAARAPGRPAAQPPAAGLNGSRPGAAGPPHPGQRVSGTPARHQAQLTRDPGTGGGPRVPRRPAAAVTTDLPAMPARRENQRDHTARTRNPPSPGGRGRDDVPRLRVHRDSGTPPHPAVRGAGRRDRGHRLRGSLLRHPRGLAPGRPGPAGAHTRRLPGYCTASHWKYHHRYVTKEALALFITLPHPWNPIPHESCGFCSYRSGCGRRNLA